MKGCMSTFGISNLAVLNITRGTASASVAGYSSIEKECSQL